ncbi:40S ribosomal protein S16 [Dictyocoela muelleri]|nr:40S ribosomal protein S16 [Dictyocoela muelleri]
MERVAYSKGTKKTAIAKASCIESPQFDVKVDFMRLDVHPNNLLVTKMRELISMIGMKHLEKLSIDIKTKGGGNVSKVYAAIQAFARSVVAYYGKFYDEQVKLDIKNKLLKYDRSTLVSDPRRCEPKKFGGPAARARYTKSYR